MTVAAALPAPLGLLAELTHRCPLGCPYCSNPLALESRDRLGDFGRILDGHEDHLDRGDARREPQAGVVAVRHDQPADHPG